MAVNDYVINSLDTSKDVFGLDRYITYSDGSVRFRLYWRRINTSNGQSITDSVKLPFNISNKYTVVSISQPDQNIWKCRTSFEIIDDNTFKLHVLSESDDYMSTLLIDLFAFL